MSSLPKRKLLYFSIDCDVLRNSKIKQLNRKFRCIGFSIYTQILTYIYDEKGYYVDCNNDFMLDLADWNYIEDAKIKEIINYMFEIGLFSRKMFKSYKILTSEEIQMKYILVKTKQRKAKYLVMNKKHLLVKEEDIPKKLQLIDYEDCAKYELAINHENDTEENEDKPEKDNAGSQDYEELLRNFCLNINDGEDWKSVYYKWCEHRINIEDPYRDVTTLQRNYTRLRNAADKDIIMAEFLVNEAMTRGKNGDWWKIFFKIKPDDHLRKKNFNEFKERKEAQPPEPQQQKKEVPLPEKIDVDAMIKNTNIGKLPQKESSDDEKQHLKEMMFFEKRVRDPMPDVELLLKVCEKKNIVNRASYLHNKWNPNADRRYPANYTNFLYKYSVLYGEAKTTMGIQNYECMIDDFAGYKENNGSITIINKTGKLEEFCSNTAIRLRLKTLYGNKTIIFKTGMEILLE